MQDPNHATMFAFLEQQCAGSEDIRFDIEEAIYWFAHDYHGGQGSNLYSVLSTSEFRPGMNARRPYAFARELYNQLIQEFAQ